VALGKVPPFQEGYSRLRGGSITSWGGLGDVYAIDNLLEQAVTVDCHLTSQQVGSRVLEFGLAIF